MKQIISISFILLFLSCQNNSSSNIEKINEKDIYNTDSEDKSMNEAINSAKESINQFDKALKSNNGNFTDFAVKKSFETQNGGEHIWIAGLSIVNGHYKGCVNNDVDEAKGIKYGDSVFVKKNEITDWMYLDKNVLKGGFTIREIRNQLNQKEKEKMDDELGFKIEE